MAPGSTMLDKVRSSLLRMTSPFEFGSERIDFDSVLTMNVPPRLARSDAAYDQVYSMIKSNVFALDDEYRQKLFQDVLFLIRESRSNIDACIIALSEENIQTEFTQIKRYLEFLDECVVNLIHLAKFQNTLPEATKIYLAKFGAPAIKTAKSGEAMFSEEEISTYHFLMEFVDSCQPAVNSLRKHHTSIFQKADLDRYTRAYEEYAKFFKKYTNPGNRPD